MEASRKASRQKIYNYNLRKQGLMTSARTAEVLVVSERTLRRWQRSGYGPPFVRRGSRILYHGDDVDMWINTKRFSGGKALSPPAEPTLPVNTPGRDEDDGKDEPGSSVKNIVLPPITHRATATILAALRFWETVGKSEITLSHPLFKVVTSGGAFLPLTDVDIEDLCKEISKALTQAKKVGGSLASTGLRPSRKGAMP